MVFRKGGTIGSCLRGTKRKSTTFDERNCGTTTVFRTIEPRACRCTTTHTSTTWPRTGPVGSTGL